MKPRTSDSYGVLAPIKPLSYLTAKVVVHYMNANKRISLTTKYPNTFKKGFERVGYRISNLKFEKYNILIDHKMFPSYDPPVNRRNLSSILGDQVHYVDCLSVGDLNSVSNIPTNLKLSVSKMVLRDDTTQVFRCIRSIITSFPLEKILICVDSPVDPVFNNCITQNDTKVLALILPRPIFGEGEWAQPLINLKHPSIELNETTISISDFIRITTDWMSSPRPIGHQIGFVTNEYMRYIQGVCDFQNRYLKIFSKRSEFFPFCLRLPAGPSESEIVIHVVKSPYYEKELRLHDRILGMLVMQVVEKGYCERVFT